MGVPAADGSLSRALHYRGCIGVPPAHGHGHGAAICWRLATSLVPRSIPPPVSPSHALPCAPVHKGAQACALAFCPSAFCPLCLLQTPASSRLHPRAGKPARRRPGWRCEVHQECVGMPPLCLGSLVGGVWACPPCMHGSKACAQEALSLKSEALSRRKARHIYGRAWESGGGGGSDAHSPC